VGVIARQKIKNSHISIAAGVESSKLKLTSRNILLISEYKQQAILHFTIRKDAMQFLPCFIYSISIVAIDYED